MKPFCEIIAFEILPAVRALVARRLTGRHGFSQKRAARLLGVSQPAVSQYRKDLRGYRSVLFRENPGLKAMAEDIADRMAAGEIKDFHSTLAFCELCKQIRFSGMGCQAHQIRYPSLGECSVCMDNKEFYGGEEKKQKP